MLRSIITILTAFVLTGCNNSQDKTSSTKDSGEAVPGPGKDLREKSEAAQKSKTTGCIFLNPDTSLSKINLRDAESAESIISSKDKIDDNEQYHYYSAMYRETLTMTHHPGDGKYQVSIFEVEYSDKADHGYRKLNIDTFKTEKGIKLGMNKKQIIEKLGSCYVTEDSSKDHIELYYRLETPNDSKTRILKSNNMPIYYASYILWKGKLKKFEFGFEYP
jgi:uncharacterized lipoprotein NlpE involved in copper resistance